ncbi:MAG: hypothetical protein WBR33_08120, partial [Pseudonocardiaceae bacterium]
YIVCELCGKRMFGKTRKIRTYYYCQPRGPRRPEGHPPTIWLPERELLAATTTFFNTHVFGPNRQELLAASVTTADLDQAHAHHEKIEAVRRTIDDLELRQERLLRTLEERDDPTGAVFDRLQQRLTSLASDHRTKLAELSQLQNAAQARPVNAVDLIQYLPETTLDLADMPHHLLRQLCDAFALRVTYNKHTHQADFNVDIAAHTIPRIQQLAIPSTTEAVGTHGQFCDEPRRGRRTADQACHSHGSLDHRRGRSQPPARSQNHLVMCRGGLVEGARTTTGASHLAAVTRRTRCSSSALGIASGTDRPSVAPTSSVSAAVLVHIEQSGMCTATRESPAGSRACNAHPTASSRCGQAAPRRRSFTVPPSFCGPRRPGCPAPTDRSAARAAAAPR